MPQQVTDSDVLDALRFVEKTQGSDIADAAARRRHPSYPVMPLASVHELMRLQRRVRARLSRITAPILIAHGALDRTANPVDAFEIVRGVASPVRRRFAFNASAHIVPVDRDGPELADAAASFLMRFASD